MDREAILLEVLDCPLEGGRMDHVGHSGRGDKLLKRTENEGSGLQVLCKGGSVPLALLWMKLLPACFQAQEDWQTDLH